MCLHKKWAQSSVTILYPGLRKFSTTNQGGSSAVWASSRWPIRQHSSSRLSLLLRICTQKKIRQLTKKCSNMQIAIYQKLPLLYSVSLYQLAVTFILSSLYWRHAGMKIPACSDYKYTCGLCFFPRCVPARTPLSLTGSTPPALHTPSSQAKTLGGAHSPHCSWSAAGWCTSPGSEGSCKKYQLLNCSCNQQILGLHWE